MVIIILVCIGFGTSVHLTNAYGMAGQFPSTPSTDYSRHSPHRHRRPTRHGNVPRLGLNLHHPNLLPLFLRSRRRCFLGLYPPSLSVHTDINSNLEQIHHGSMVSIHGSRHHDLFHGLLEMGNAQKTKL